MPARGQVYDASSSKATIETAVLDLRAPERYQVPVVLEAARRVTIRAADDGIVRELKVNLGDRVKNGNEVAVLDQAEAVARVEIAKAELARRQALADGLKSPGAAASPSTEQRVAEAEIKDAQARVRLAEIALARLTLQTPINGRVLDIPLSEGQYVRQGDEIADIADESLLTALVPVDRTTVRLGQKIELPAGETKVSGMIRALVPLPPSMTSLYELNGNWGAAMVLIANNDDMLEPGQRLDPGSLPEQPVATIEARALSQTNTPSVQVLRDDHAVRVPVRIFGGQRTGRLQVSGAFRPTDLLVVSSNPPLVDGAYVRFGSAASPTTSEPVSTPPPAQPPVAQRPSATPTRPGGLNPAPSRTAPRQPAPTPTQTRPAPKPTTATRCRSDERKAPSVDPAWSGFPSHGRGPRKKGTGSRPSRPGFPRRNRRGRVPVPVFRPPSVQSA